MLNVTTTAEKIGELNNVSYQLGANAVYDALYRMIMEQGISKGRAFERAAGLLPGYNYRQRKKNLGGK
jgi:hypothetical protein